MINADGSGRTPLTSNTDSGREYLDPAWSPDGSRLTFTKTSDPLYYRKDIWVVNADGTGERQITTARGFTPDWR